MNKRILLVRPDGIGDFVLFSAVLEKYKELYSDYEMDVLCHPMVKELVETIPFIRRVYCIHVFKINWKKYLPYLTYQLVQLNFNGYEKIIYPVYSRVQEADVVIDRIRAKEKIAFDGNGSNDPNIQRSKRNHIFTKIVISDTTEKKEIERNAEFLAKLGAEIHSAELIPKVWFGSQDDQLAGRLMREENLVSQKYICIFPGAGHATRYWGKNKWGYLINKIIENYPNFKIVILGAGGDNIPIREILDSLININGDKIVNLYGKTGLRVLAKIIKNSCLYIGMETGATHIAAAVGVPNICIIGGGHFGRFYPYGDLNRNRIVHHQMDCYGCDWRCIYDTIKCIDGIKVDNVFREVEVFMNTSLAN